MQGTKRRRRLCACHQGCSLPLPGHFLQLLPVPLSSDEAGALGEQAIHQPEVRAAGFMAAAIASHRGALHVSSQQEASPTATSSRLAAKPCSRHRSWGPDRRAGRTRGKTAL